MLTFVPPYFTELALILFLNNTTFFNFFLNNTTAFSYLVKKIQPPLYCYNMLPIYHCHNLYDQMFVLHKFFILYTRHALPAVKKTQRRVPKSVANPISVIFSMDFTLIRRKRSVGVFLRGTLGWLLLKEI